MECSVNSQSGAMWNSLRMWIAWLPFFIGLLVATHVQGEQEAEVGLVEMLGEETRARTIRTPIPNIYEDWKILSVGRMGSDEELQITIDQQRRRVASLVDPFTRLMSSCTERVARQEKVVWEDDLLLVDKFDSRRKLLAIPKMRASFLVDLPKNARSRLALVAAAACDALVEASAMQPDQYTASCQIYVNPPLALGVSQLHVHVVPTVVSQDVVDPSNYLSTVNDNLQELLGVGGQCSE
jgi:diadenosine tetraphosphate (Ap4A) HIT family hydrolase